eukprot:COSAG01_NODE_45545_length_408_cov_1.365696_1_plen_98_part_10
METSGQAGQRVAPELLRLSPCAHIPAHRRGASLLRITAHTTVDAQPVRSSDCDTGAGGDNGIDQNQNSLRCTYDSTVFAIPFFPPAPVPVDNVASGS